MPDDYPDAVRQRFPAGGPADTAVVSIDAEKARHFVERLRGRQSLVRAVLAGLPTAAVVGLVGGALGGLLGSPLEWLAWLAVGCLVGAAVRLSGRGLGRRFGVAGAALTLLGCLASHAVALSVAVAMQAPGVGNFEVLARGDPDLLLRLARAGLHWADLPALGLALYAGYSLSFRRITAQEMAHLAREEQAP